MMSGAARVDREMDMGVKISLAWFGKSLDSTFSDSRLRVLPVLFEAWAQLILTPVREMEREAGG